MLNITICGQVMASVSFRRGTNPSHRHAKSSQPFSFSIVRCTHRNQWKGISRQLSSRGAPAARLPHIQLWQQGHSSGELPSRDDCARIAPRACRTSPLKRRGGSEDGQAKAELMANKDLHVIERRNHLTLCCPDRAPRRVVLAHTWR